MRTTSGLLATATLCAAGAVVASHDANSTAWLHQHDDVNRDRQADIFFRGGTALAFWELGRPMGETVVSGGSYAGDAGPGYSVVAVSDFDGDESADVMWSNGSDLKLWINDGSGSYMEVPVGNYGGGWQPFAAGDINGDGRSDLFFRGSTHLAYWLMDGPRVIASSYAGDGGAGYRVVAIDAFTRDYFDGVYSVDVLWTNGSQLKLWVGNSTSGTFTSSPLGSYGDGWEPFAGGDVSGDGVADILFRGGTHLAYWKNVGVSPLRYESVYAGDGGAGFRVISVSAYGGYAEGAGKDVLWSDGSQLKLWKGTCPVWDWDYGCVTQAFTPHMLGSYSGGWQPLEMLIPHD